MVQITAYFVQFILWRKRCML